MPDTPKHIYQIELGFVPTISDVQGDYKLWPGDSSPMYEEIESSDELRDADEVSSDLQTVDWSFTAADTAFLTHDLHPYPAKFIPQIPGHLIARLSLRGELVLDPFGGSGTTALEAIRLGRRALSADANAVGTLIGKVKTCNPDRSAATDLHAIRSALTTQLVELPTVEKLCMENEGYIPVMPNIDKWFPLTSRGELAVIRSRIAAMESETARDMALLALSKIVLRVSFQDSETRYASKPHEIPQGEALKQFLVALDEIVKSVARTQSSLRYGVCQFVTADTRQLGATVCNADSIDLIVTSPPYGNANDYHLYHRFRLLWLGHDPGELAKMEIGSHLRHQRESSGFDSYLNEMEQSLSGMYRVLKPGRYAVLVVGDPIYQNVLYQGAEAMGEIGQGLGFELVCIIERKIHSKKRSFVAVGRRATTEKLIVLRKPPSQVTVWFQPPPYKMWPYEAKLRGREVETVLDVELELKEGHSISLTLDPYTVTKARRLVFTHSVGLSALHNEPTWQAIVENGFVHQAAARKDPKYVTHGLHSYKGKFYPQLAKGLINLCDLKPDAKILDPFCGSGTTLLEAYLNGHGAFGCDMNPLAAKIARAKVGILEVNPAVVRDAVGTLVHRLEEAPNQLPKALEQLHEQCLDEIERWFPLPVVSKLNWLLRSIRSVSEGVIRDFLEVILSSIIREISQQDPNDLRIRRRKEPIEDADILRLFLDTLDTQYERIEKFWSIRGYAPSNFKACRVLEGDARKETTFGLLGLENCSIDLILTSPPYATALPYIDTDRLSLLVLMGMDASMRRPVDHHLIGSREIVMKERRQLEKTLAEDNGPLPKDLREYLQDLHDRVTKADVGFRRKNMPALLFRFFRDMDLVIKNCCRVLRPGGEAMMIIGDNRIRVGEEYERIATTDFLEAIALVHGLELMERIDISVTTDNLVHAKNAITQNVVLRLKRPHGPRVAHA